MLRRFATIIVLLAVVLGIFLPLSPSASAAFENTYVNTGNQAEDLIGVAMTQVGYTEGPDNDTKYGDWLGFPNLPWCASFISWCAYQADISPRILQRTALANPGANPGFGIPCYHGSEYTPKRGDLFFKEDFSHVGIVYGVEGDEVLTIEANTNDDGSDEGYAVLLRRRKIAECYFGVPAYKGTDKPHTYVRKSDPGHPHPAYYQCTTCGHLYYTATPTHRTDCRFCMSCRCSTAVEGYYKVSQMDDRLVVYSEEAPKSRKEYSSRKGYLEPDELVYVVAGDRDWGHIIYANSVGYVKMKYLQKFVPAPTDVATGADAYYEGDTAYIHWGQVHTATDYIVTLYQDGQEILSRNTTGDTAVSLEDLACGHYRVDIQASDGTTFSEATGCEFRVLQTYTLTFESDGGAGGATQQTKYADQDLILETAVPTREGYRFLGWSEELRTNYAIYQPGDVWSFNRDDTLYAIWQDENAVPTQLKIRTPAKDGFITLGNQPDTSGMELMLVYSDGTVRLIRSGFEMEPFAPRGAGIYPVTLRYEDLTVSYDVQVLTCPVEIDYPWIFTMDVVINHK